MLKKTLAALFCFFPIIGCGSQAPQSQINLDYYGGDSVPAEIKFETYFTFPANQLEGTYLNTIEKLDDLYEADQKTLKDALKLQTKHLYGVFTYHEAPTDFVNNPGSILEVEKVTIGAVTKARDRIRVEYTFTDQAAFYKDLVSRTVTKISFYLPTSPTEIYQYGIPTNSRTDPATGEPINPCSDLHDNSNLAFWYYWSPDREDCPKSFRKHIHLVEGTIVKKPSTIKTFPEYERLRLDNHGQKTDLKIALLIGPDESMQRANDLGRYTFEALYRFFKKWKVKSGKKVLKITENKRNRKTFELSNDEGRAQIRLIFANPDAKTFPQLAGELYRDSGVFIYSGHSAEDYYFDPNRIFIETNIEFPKNRYQVMFLNACTTYSYHHSNYFDLKKTDADPNGTKNLDVLLNVIGSPFLAGPTGEPVTAEVILTAAMLGIGIDGKPLEKKQSWQQILNAIRDSVDPEETSMTNVTGDEDNPTSPLN